MFTKSDVQTIEKSCEVNFLFFVHPYYGGSLFVPIYIVFIHFYDGNLLCPFSLVKGLQPILGIMCLFIIEWEFVVLSMIMVKV